MVESQEPADSPDISRSILWCGACGRLLAIVVTRIGEWPVGEIRMFMGRDGLGRHGTFSSRSGQQAPGSRRVQHPSLIPAPGGTAGENEPGDVLPFLPEHSQLRPRKTRSLDGNHRPRTTRVGTIPSCPKCERRWGGVVDLLKAAQLMTLLNQLLDRRLESVCPVLNVQPERIAPEGIATHGHSQRSKPKIKHRQPIVALDHRRLGGMAR
jgi:hypothetical protein